MDRQQFITLTALALFTAFLAGWIARFLVARLVRPAGNDLGELDRLARELHEADRRDRRPEAVGEHEAPLRLVDRDGGEHPGAQDVGEQVRRAVRVEQVQLDAGEGEHDDHAGDELQGQGHLRTVAAVQCRRRPA